MIYTEHLHRPIVFVKVFVDVTWTTVDIWYIATHEIIVRLCSAACCDGVFGNGEKSRGGKSSGLFHLVNIEGQMFAECPE